MCDIWIDCNWIVLICKKHCAINICWAFLFGTSCTYDFLKLINQIDSLLLNKSQESMKLMAGYYGFQYQNITYVCCLFAKIRHPIQKPNKKTKGESKIKISVWRKNSNIFSWPNLRPGHKFVWG